MGILHIVVLAAVVIVLVLLLFQLFFRRYTTDCEHCTETPRTSTHFDFQSAAQKDTTIVEPDSDSESDVSDLDDDD